MVSDTQQLRQDETSLLLDLESEESHEEACEGPLHPTGTAGHEPNEPAAWLLVPVCMHDILMCDAWLRAGDAEFGVDGWSVKCHRCGAETLAEDLVRIRIRD